MRKTLILLAALLAAGHLGQMAQAGNKQADMVAPPVPRPDYRPTILPDAVLYKNIFSLQETGKWGRADRLIKKLEDTTLMGHVLYQRYMHPTAYRAKWTELRDWLKNYADQPGAWRLYKLAQKRKPRGVSMPKRPPSRVYFNERASAGERLFRTRTARRIKKRVEYLVRHERPTQALTYISERAQDRRLKRTETHFLKSLIARSYYIEGKIEASLKLAREATESRANVQMSDWHAGLAAYRLNQIDTAITHFEKLARNRTASPTLRAKASYWAARGLRQTGEVENAEQHFRAAARTGGNFYALLAMQHIRGGMTIEWRQATSGQDNLFIAHPAVRRAQALRQAEQEELAELELLYLQERLSDIEARALMAFARDNQYPAVQLALATRLGGNTANGLPLPLLEGSYPIVDIATNGVDRALVLALIRQESRFKARAKSHAGARGLMQIMPGTAAFVTGDWSLYRRRGRDQLLDAQLNLEIGQKYLTMLMDETYFSGSLVHMLAAYNGGPGNVRRWRRELSDVQDPLLFIESLPAPETRNYVQKVMANLWIYRDRLAQSPDSQRILAAESWPLYRAQDGRGNVVPASIR